MNRRDLFRLSSALGLTAALPGIGNAGNQATAPAPLHPPATGSIPVAFLLSEDAVVIDFAGPWEVFSNVSVPGRPDAPVFQLYTVAATKEPIKASGGMTIVPSYTYDTAPQPKVIVIPAQSDRSEATLAWIRQAAQGADLTMSVCTGAFLLARTGLLAGKAATTHHGAYKELAMKYPDITVKRGARFVEAGNVASAGGLSSGIDLALRVVERYFGRTVASNTATTLEYQGQGWLDPNANQAYARVRSASGQPLCPVCDMEVDKRTAPSSTYRGKTYYFCVDDHRKLFDTKPAVFLAGA
ncbi:YHS domain-containing protein [Pseudoduganella flava]|uniref:YHS domain-containing protein n=1 Tax=Pseudoduganella flava TaxID=871742 RepID=A0A562PMZ0_9BURK|nr:DJ-1/PfpI family protein [Pseudoduganella flava]QGZ40398.1 YHS domain-containing protein [Pseudoduganella flava]TWI45832.1 YHS domain-containing protein [Pseudoduganella flava]